MANWRSFMKPENPVARARQRTTRLDARGLRCPLPVLKARKALKDMRHGELLELLSDDPVAAIDVPHFCNEAGHRLVGHETMGDLHIFHIQRSRMAR